MLAAGRSSRFGAEDKLLAVFRGKPLFRHAADVFAGLDFKQRLIVCSSTALETPQGFARVNVPAGQPQSASLKAAMEALDGAGVDAVLLALADMPLVPARHITALMDAFQNHDDQPTASAADGRAMPPAIFGRSLWPQLSALSGDQGARALLGHATLIEAPHGTLVDVDCREDIDRLRVRTH